MPFLTSASLLAAYDERQWRQNLSDTNAPIVGDILSNSYMAEIAVQAEGEILSAAACGERYSQGQLESLAADPTSPGGALLRRLCADLAYAMVLSRRGKSAADVSRLCPRYGAAQTLLEQLRLGHRVFPGVVEAQEAGLPALGDGNTNRNRPVTFTQQAHRLFPWSCNRMGPGC